MYPNVYGESSTDTTQTSWNRLDEAEPYNLYGFYGVLSLNFFFHHLITDLSISAPNEAASLEAAPNVQVEFRCPLCSRVFLSKQNIPLHMRTMHAKAIYCHLCYSAFDTREQLAVHQNSKKCTPIKIPDCVGVRIYIFVIHVKW